jgi:poly(hydroxyalkanoate) depolymerase family esterase
MLHGCTQDAADFARGTAMNCHAEERGMLVLWPEQSKGANPSRCWNWFDPAHQAADGGEPARIADLVRRLVREHGLDESRVFAAGLSAGGAAAAVLGATHPELFAGIGIHSGLACGAATDLPSALMAMKRGAAGRRPLAFVPTIIFHGDRDQTVHHVNGEQIMALARQASRAPLETRVETGAEPGGHAWTRTVARDATGRIRLEQWVVHGAAHAWSGGDPAGRYTDPAGPDASAAMLHFFLDRG